MKATESLKQLKTIWPHKVWVWMAVCLFSALSMYGYHHPDELGQITSFYLVKAGVQPEQNMPWEFVAQMRPWLQPSIYYAMTYPFIKLFGYHHVLMERFLHIIQFLFVVLCLPFLLRMFRDTYSTGSQQEKWMLIYLGSLWFVPSMIVRHSSEAFAIVMMTFALGLWSLNYKHQGKGFVLIASGVFAAFSFWVRFQIAFFWVGFGIVWLIKAIHRKQYRKILLFFSCGAVLGLFIGFGVDWWGYGTQTYSFWNYFYYNVVLGKVNDFGRVGSLYYFLQTIAFTLNPLIWFWLIVAIYLSRRNVWYTSLSAGLVLFLLAHLFISHKEMRFLFPMIVPLSLLMVYLSRNTDSWPWKKFIFNTLYLKIFSVANIIVLILFSLFGLTKDKQRMELALYKLPEASVVITNTNVFGGFDEQIHEYKPKHPEYHWEHMFAKPSSIKLIFSHAQSFKPLCEQYQHAYLLLSSSPQKQYRMAGALQVDLPVKTIYQFPPSWLVSEAGWYKRMWRFKIATCQEYLNALGVVE